MNKQNYTLIRSVMHEYISKGKKVDYKAKQITRLVAILDEIMQIENKPLSGLGRKDIIRYYYRHSSETYRTLKEKYSILEKFFAEYKPDVRVPKPDPSKCHARVIL